MKALNIILVIALSVIGAEANAKKTLNSVEKEALGIVKNFNELFWNYEDVEASAALLSDDFTVRETSNNFISSPLSPAEAVKKRTFLHSKVPGLKYKIEDTVVQDNTVTLFINAKFNHTKVIKTKVGIAPPTGQIINYKVVQKYEVENGKIANMWFLYDMFSRDLQMGLYPELYK